ncbi:hypothetical protein PRZ01_02740 [Paucibacter sp. hw1]|uniref:Uncharacterized protein n=1 Tax=Roseateles koreensis TaxID=2987526 RepID=A0ABT5KMP9_9BURK|nr:hypothetical protein [Roseateles koreensis]MDC8784107.1 hypothetical protein [Roseateles koreensis]
MRDDCIRAYDGPITDGDTGQHTYLFTQPNVATDSHRPRYDWPLLWWYFGDRRCVDSTVATMAVVGNEYPACDQSVIADLHEFNRTDMH